MLGAQNFKSNIHFKIIYIYIYIYWLDSPQWARVSSFTKFLNHIQRRSTVGRTFPDQWSARRRDLYLTTHNTHNRQISMPPVGFESTVSAGERPQTYASDRTATGTGGCIIYSHKNNICNTIHNLNAINLSRAVRKFGPAFWLHGSQASQSTAWHGWARTWIRHLALIG